jgi:hypothetical protein
MTYTHIDIDDDLLGRAAGALGTKQKKDTVEAALRAAVEKAEKDQAWSHLWGYVDAGGFSSDVYVEAEREHLAHEQAKLDEHAQQLDGSSSEGAA